MFEVATEVRLRLRFQKIKSNKKAREKLAIKGSCKYIGIERKREFIFKRIFFFPSNRQVNAA